MKALAASVVVLGVALGCSKDPQPQKARASTTSEPPAVSHMATPGREPVRPAQLSRVTLKALGMYCEESCPMRVRYALADLTTVYELGFDLANESIFVSYDASLGPAKQVTKPMLDAIKTAGFDPWLAKESWPDDAKVQVVLR